MISSIGSLRRNRKSRERSLPPRTFVCLCLSLLLASLNSLSEQFGLSNYLSWEVAEIYKICEANSYVLPTVYEGIYNAIDRAVEAELIPCLRRFGIKFAAYTPLAGGLLAGAFHTDQGEIKAGSRFDEKDPFAYFYRARYLHSVGPVRELQTILVTRSHLDQKTSVFISDYAGTQRTYIISSVRSLVATPQRDDPTGFRHHLRRE